MPTRNRTADGQFTVCGWYHNNPVNLHVQRCMTHGSYGTCDDTIDNWDGVNPFLVTKRFTYYPALGGQEKHANGSVLREFVDYPPAYRPGAPDPVVQFANFTSLDLSNYAWEILGKTNPNVPHVSVPQMVGELNELPSLFTGWGFKHWPGPGGLGPFMKRWGLRGLPRLVGSYGYDLLKQVAKGHLSWRWAARPMISDLSKLLKFSKAIDDRIIYLMRLRDGKSLRRRCHLGKTTAKPAPSYVILHSEGAVLKGWRQLTYTSEVWGTAHWKVDPASNLPSLGYGPLKDIARRLTFGITSHEALSAAWELTPWSWLVDWFTDVGDVIAATNNSVPLTWSKVCLMRTRLGKSTYTLDKAASATWPTFKGWYVEDYSRKERQIVFPVTPVPIPYLPLFNWGKSSILASLAALRF